MRGFPLLAAIFAALALPAAGAAGVLPVPTAADLTTTGNQSEQIDTISVSPEEGADQRVVMSIGPQRMTRLQEGDRLRVSGEIQISTTCVTESAGCIGTPYKYNPTLTARIMLTDDPEEAYSGMALSDRKLVRCKQLRPNRNHHCTLVMGNRETTIGDLSALPCPANQCYVNLVAGAWHKRAQGGDRVVVGADRPDGSVVQDKGRLNVIHLGAEASQPENSSSSALVSDSLPLTEGKVEKRRVIHSLEIDAPRKGDVLAFDGGFTATIDQLPYNTFIASRVIVAESPTATEPTGLARGAVHLKGDATEGNGFNCTQGPSGYPTPCTVRKAGAIRITQDVVDPVTMLPGKLYLNLLGSAKPLLARNVEPADAVIVGAGVLSLDRYRIAP